MPRADAVRRAFAVEFAAMTIAILVTVGVGALAFRAVWAGAWQAVLAPLAIREKLR